jgi:nucleotide-binding universal stress UspA family protein
LLADVARAAGTEGEQRAVADLSPARALQQVAEDLGADLIVVGSARHAAGRLLAGSVAGSTRSGAPCPVAVSPAGYEGSRLSTVGVAFDGSPESREALILAADLVRARSARLRVVHVVGQPREVVAPMYPLAYAPHEWEHHGELEVARARSVMERAVADLGREVEAEGEVVFGHARKELASLSRWLDLLVVGSRGWGPARRVLLGSTSNHLMHHAACPVLVIPRTAVDKGERAGKAVETASA